MFRCLFLLLVLVTSVSCQSNKPGAVVATAKLPLVFHPGYDISFLGLEKLHPFDSAKYGKIHRQLISKTDLEAGDFHRPVEASREQLGLVHGEAYLDSLKKSVTAARIAEMPVLGNLPASLVDRSLLRPMRLATGGTVLASQLALKHGWAINLSGGYHHAKPASGEGFCVYADLPVAAEVLWQSQPALRLLVIDLDAHQGNGLEVCFRDDPRVHIFDLYNRDIYPCDEQAKAFIDTDLPVPAGTSDIAYLALLDQHLPGAFDEARPDLVLYNAGTDIFEGDPLGALQVSAAAIIQRDEKVFREARRRGVPIVMVPSGGYTAESAVLVSDSISNLLADLFAEPEL